MLFLGFNFKLHWYKPILIGAIYLLCFSNTYSQCSSQLDTAGINQLYRNAFSIYRTYPDSALSMGCKMLALSGKIDYQMGVAHANCILAYAHLMMFSPNDSAYFYFQKSRQQYLDLDNWQGLGQVHYGLGYYYSFKGDLLLSKKQMQFALIHFKRAKFHRGICNTYSALAYVYEQYKDYDSAYAHIDSAIFLAQQNKNWSALADFYNSKGNIYKDQALFQHAIDVYFKALVLWEQAGDSAGLAIAFGSVGNMYYHQNDFKKALEYFCKKLPISLRTNQYYEVSKTYSSIALLFLESGTYDSALYFLHKSLEINRRMNFPKGMAEAYFKIAQSHYQLEHYDSSMTYTKKAITIARNINMTGELAAFHLLLGSIYTKMGDMGKAKKSIDRGYQIARENQMPLELAEAAEKLSDYYANKKDYVKAFSYFKEHTLNKDKLTKDANIKRITQLEMQYEFDKRQQKLDYETEQERISHRAALAQQRNYILILLLIIVLIGIFGAMYFRQRNIQNKFRTLELEQRLLRSQMNPHFIFNSLCAIQNYMLHHELKEASQFLSKFSSLMRQILENSRVEYIPIEKELEALENYMDLQKLRFENQFDYEISVDREIDTEVVAIPPMLAQPFIENSIEHGIKPLGRAGNIKIDFKLVQNSIILNLQDDGVGINQSLAQKSIREHSESLAIELTRERLKKLKIQGADKASLTIKDLSLNNSFTGTKVLIQFPFKRIYR